MPKSTMTSKGQVTIPKSVRERLGLEAGVVLEFLENGAGEVILRKSAKSDGIIGLLRHLAPARPVTVEEMNEAVRQRAAAKSRALRASR
jgi:antitoxin PrlF